MANDRTETTKEATDEEAWEAYRTAAPTRDDIEGSALKNAWFDGLKRGREDSQRLRCALEAADKAMGIAQWGTSHQARVAIWRSITHAR